MAGKHRAKTAAPRDGGRRPLRMTPLLIAAVAVAAIVLVGVILTLTSNDSSGRKATSLTTPASTSSTPTTPLSTPATSTAPATSTRPATTPARTTAKPAPKPKPRPTRVAAAVLDVRALWGSSWLTVRDHAGRTLYDALLPRGHAAHYTDRSQLTVVIGNAAAVDIYAGGRHLRRGGEGQVLRIVIRR